MNTWALVFTITQHTLTIGLLGLAQYAYWYAVAKRQEHPVHGHVIFWLAWLGITVGEAFFLWKDVR